MGLVVNKLTTRSDAVSIILGLGLLGNAIANRLQLFNEQLAKPNKSFFTWNNASLIIDEIKKYIQISRRNNIEIIWCAGVARFSASNQEMEKEYDLYSDVLLGLFDKYGKKMTVNMLSSAGGIYEGNSYITDIEQIAPLRPYGDWKLKQEEFLNDYCIPNRIYRLASVYGSTSLNRSHGLIDVLIRNARLGSNTLIYASMNTLRDYIFTADIARIICNDVMYNNHSSIKILASGRCVSINMLINMVSKIIKKRIKVTYSPTETNNRDIIFSHQLLSRDSRITPLEAGIPILNANYYN